MGWQRVRPNLVTEKQQLVTESCHYTAEINTTCSVNNLKINLGGKDI